MVVTLNEVSAKCPVLILGKVCAHTSFLFSTAKVWLPNARLSKKAAHSRTARPLASSWRG